MEPVAQANFPTLRFKDDQGKNYPDWVERQLKNVCEINPPSKLLPNTFTYIDLESVRQGMLVNHNKILKDNAPSRAQRALQKRDVLFQTVRPYQQNNFYFDLEGDFVASTGYAQLRAMDSPRFLYYCLHVVKVVNRVLARCTGTSYPAINSNDLSGIKLFLPTKPEQQKIASFLSSVDQKIEQLTHKKAMLEQFKKGLMQKLFSQQIRFKAEQGKDYPEWEEEELGSISKFSKGKGISKNDIEPNGKVKCIRYGELYTDYHEIISEVFSATNASTKNLVLSKKNDVIIPSSGETALDIASASCLNLEGVALGGDINIIRCQLNGEYLAYYLNSKMKHAIARLAQGISVIHLYATHLKSLRLELPSTDEQQKIASFLSAIDRKIELVSEQIQRTQTFKKGLLQQMFV